jgi:hypothetical protein
MENHTEITETNLQPVLRVHLQVGNFYKAMNMSIWCCFQYYDGYYHCIRTPDNVIARFQENGYLQRDDGTAEDTLMERYVHPSQNPGIDIVERLNLIIQQVDDLLPIVEGQAIIVQKLTHRIRHLRGVLGKIANGKVVGDETITTAQDALLWLADREANPLGDQ